MNCTSLIKLLSNVHRSSALKKTFHLADNGLMLNFLAMYLVADEAINTPAKRMHNHQKTSFKGFISIVTLSNSCLFDY